MEELDGLAKKYFVPDEEINDIFEEALLPKINLKNITSELFPTAVIIGGQPGSGKTQIIEQVKKDFNNNIVECNADKFRDLHPFTDNIRQNHENLYPELTAGFSQKLDAILRSACEKRKLNYLLEITFRDGVMLNNTIAHLKQLGYKVNLYLLAVNERWSKLGTYERLESQRRIDGTGRMVKEDAHDIRYKAIPSALKEVTNKKLYDNLSIYSRVLLEKNDILLQQVILKAINPVDPIKTYLNERDRPFTKEEKNYFNNTVADIVYFMQRRNASEEEIKTFRKKFERMCVEEKTQYRRKM